MLSHDLHLLSAASPSYDVPHDAVAEIRQWAHDFMQSRSSHLDLSSSGKWSDGVIVGPLSYAACRPLPTNSANIDSQFMYPYIYLEPIVTSEFDLSCVISRPQTFKHTHGVHTGIGNSGGSISFSMCQTADLPTFTH